MKLTVEFTPKKPNKAVILEEKEAKEYFNNATNELLDGIKEPQYLNKPCGGYWETTNKKGDTVWEAFDNYTADCFIETFDIKEEAIKYAKGEESLTIGGYKI